MTSGYYLLRTKRSSKDSSHPSSPFPGKINSYPTSISDHSHSHPVKDTAQSFQNTTKVCATNFARNRHYYFCRLKYKFGHFKGYMDQILYQKFYHKILCDTLKKYSC